jgi:CRP-like cAMP-binding protein
MKSLERRPQEDWTVKGNKLLTDLDERELALLAPYLQEVAIERGRVLAEAGEPLPYVYFPVEGVLSFVGATENGATVEVADVGREGVAAVTAIIGTRHLPFRVVSKVSGRSLRIPTELVARQVRECGALHARLLEATDAIIAQISQSAVCNRYHNARERLARWLLTTADRAETLDLPVTHEFISSMVGGPRSAVTEASAELRVSGAIEYSRGLLSIRDGDRLRAECCECYENMRNGAVVEEAVR